MSSRPRAAVSWAYHNVLQAFVAAVGRLDKSLSPQDTFRRLGQYTFTYTDSIYIFHMAQAIFWLTLMESPGFPLKLAIPILYTIALLIPFTSQFFLPATPVFAWLLTYYTSRFIPVSWRPTVSVSVLPTLESVLYGANISDILTRFTHPFLDIIAWMPYGVGHFTVPFFVAAFLWLFRPKRALHLWARTFGYLNLIGVWVQIIFPCAAPWYELIYGLTPASYGTPGSAGGLARIDKIFHSHGYSSAFGGAPVVFGAFPSLHAACATIEALFMSHFFPGATKWVWAYTGVLYWATMYLTHHYLIDVVGGACLAVACFYLFLPDEFKEGGNGSGKRGSGGQRSKYEQYDLEAPRTRGRMNGSAMMNAADFDVSETSSQASEEEEMDIMYRSPNPAGTPANGGPFIAPGSGRKSHKHTASIARLIRPDERSGGDGWSGSGFVRPSTPTKGDGN